MTKSELAAKLNGREYGHEITESEAIQAKEAGLLIIFGYSDDNAEFRGAFDDEVDSYKGATIYLHRGGVLQAHDYCECPFCGYEAMKSKCVAVEAIWGDTVKEAATGVAHGYSWTYKTTLPHATFDIVEGDEKYCRGIVLSISDLPTI